MAQKHTFNKLAPSGVSFTFCLQKELSIVGLCLASYWGLNVITNNVQSPIQQQSVTCLGQRDSIPEKTGKEIKLNIQMGKQ